MFICGECLEKYDNWSAASSWGPCELCKRTRGCYDIHGDLIPKVKEVIKPSKELITLLKHLYKMNIKQIAVPANSLGDIEYMLSCDDKDWVILFRDNCENMSTSLTVCDNQTTSEPIYKDWFMTITYHA